MASGHSSPRALLWLPACSQALAPVTVCCGAPRDKLVTMKQARIHTYWSTPSSSSNYAIPTPQNLTLHVGAS